MENRLASDVPIHLSLATFGLRVLGGLPILDCELPGCEVSTCMDAPRFVSEVLVIIDILIAVSF